VNGEDSATMGLRDWNTRLEAHFDQLRKQRSAAVGDRPIFALEHGLSSTELQDLDKHIREDIAKGAPNRDDALPWIVYAAEVGYRYEGDEYWQTFEAETPGWAQFGRRSWIRDRYTEFSKRFGGAKPTGPWAEWFTNICWPITHAILPQYLQRQMAEILYELRHAFTANVFESPDALGRMIAARSLNASSRFQILAQDTLLLGQIAAALLIQKGRDSRGLILPSTLKRIVEDLERERQAREWLLEARTSAERAQLRGLTRDPTGRARPKTVDSPREAREQIAELAIEPRLTVIPVNGRWEVWLEIPDLSPLITRFPELQTVLTQSRCTVAGSSGRPLWQGRLLHGGQRVRLQKWPTAAEPLLQFERSTPDLDFLLRTDCLLRPGPRWLFRVASDGIGYELQRLLVRTNRTYILLSTVTPAVESNGITSVDVGCAGVHALRLDVPNAVSDEWLARLRHLGLSDVRALDVWPAALSPASWNGDGRAEWLTSDPVCIAIRADHPIEALTVTLDQLGEAVTLSGILEGKTTFLELPPLSAGTHRVTVTVGGGATRVEDGYLDIAVRAPRPWVPGVSSQGALMVQIDPHAPSLEQLWDGRTSVEIQGPAGRHVRCTASLFQRNAAAPLVRRRLPPLQLPVGTPGWQSHFEKFFQRAADVQNYYEQAQRCVIELSAGELGQYSLACEREFTPLRWAVGKSGADYRITLIDEAGFDTPALVTKYDFRTPDVAEALDSFSRSEIVPPKGGMYVARSGDYSRAIILPPTTLRSFADLKVYSRVATRDTSTDGVVSLFTLACSWHSARLAGDQFLVATRRRDVVSALMERTCALIGGDNWGRAELQSRSVADNVALRLLADAISVKPRERGLAERVMLERDRFVAVEPQQRARYFAALAKSFLLLPTTDAGLRVVVEKGGVGTLVRRLPSAADPEWLCEFALRLTSCSDTTSAWAGVHFRDGIARLRAIPVLARSARFVVLATDRWHQPEHREIGPVYQSWKWQ
jgi:hypothetical protein